MNDSIVEMSREMRRDKENLQENIEINAKMYTNSEYSNPASKKMLVKGMHLVRKMREVRDMERRVVMCEIENV